MNASKTFSDADSIVRMAGCPVTEWEKIALAICNPQQPGFGHVPPPGKRLNAQDTIKLCDSMIQRIARFREYLEQRHGAGCGDQGHETAVKEQNKLTAKIRKALGFTFAKSDITF